MFTSLGFGIRLQPRSCVEGDSTKWIPRFSIIGSFRLRAHALGWGASSGSIDGPIRSQLDG